MEKKSLDVVVLCGGLGTRFREVSQSTPKALAEVARRPFLDILLDFFVAQGFQRFILCVGHQADQIKSYYLNHRYSSLIKFSEEDRPLGTGGAVKNARTKIESESFLVVNGDSFCGVDLDAFLNFHNFLKKSLVSIVSTVSLREDGGSVFIDDNSNMVVSYREKVRGLTGGLINAGIYLMSQKTLEIMPAYKTFSLEYDFFPQLSNKSLYGFYSTGELVDIGTKDRYEKAQSFFEKLKISVAQ